MDGPAPAVVSRDRLSDQIYAVLKQEIVKGQLTAGQRVIEADVARRFEVSHAPVREALRRLAHEGLVVQLPRRGTFVSSVSEDEARRTHALRAVLEEFAARECCEHASDDDLDRLGGIIERMEAAGRDGAWRDVMDLNVQFHHGVWAAADHPLLPRIWPLIEASLRAFTPITDQVFAGELLSVAESHRPLLRALRDRDITRVGQTFRDHVTNVWTRVEPTDDD